MRALVLKDFGQLEVIELPDPTPAADEVVIRVEAVGICGSDIHGFTGENGRRIPGQVMGHEASGVVVAAPPHVALAEGDAVTFNPVIGCGDCAACASGETQRCAERRVIGVDPTFVAAFAEYVRVPADRVVRLPEGFPTALGALVEPLAVALHAVRRSGLAVDEDLLVVGGGPIAQSAILAARSVAPRRIVASEIDADRRELCRALGAVAIDPLADDFESQVRGSLGDLADVAIDAVGVSGSLADALRSTKFGGTVALVGMGSPRLELSAYAVSTEERSIVGCFCYSDAEFRDAVAIAAEHEALLRHMVTAEVSFDGAQEAMTALGRGAAVPGKVLIRPAAAERAADAARTLEPIG